MDRPKKRWKKILLYFLATIFSLICILFVLFCILIANPFESSYQQNLASLLPADSDSIAYISDAKQLWSDVQQSFPFAEINKTVAFRQFARTREYRNLQKAWKQLQKQQKKADFEFLKEEYFWKIFKGEFAASVRIKDKKPQILCVLRIDFLVRVAEGISPYAIPEDITKKYKVNLENVFKKVQVQNQYLFFALQKDLLFISSSQDYLEESWRLVQNNNNSILTKSSILKTRTAKKQQSILMYVKNDIINEHIPKRLANKMQPIVDFNALGNTFLSLSFTSQITIEGITELDSTSPYYEKIYQIPVQDFPATILPNSVYIKTQIPIDIAMWNNLYKRFPNRVRRDLEKRIRWLNQNYRTTDFISERIFNNIDQQIVVACMPIDYVKEGIDVLDPYPAVCVFVPSPNVDKFYGELQNLLRKETAKTKGKVNIKEETYGQHTFTRIDIGGFDFTGGAIQPVLTKIDNYIVFSSHDSFLRSLIDIQDQIAAGWNTSALYRFSKKAQKLSSSIRFSIAGDGIIEYVETAKEIWAEEIALTLFNRNPRGRKMEQIKTQLLRQWRKSINYAKSFITKAMVEVETSTDEILWNINLSIKVR